MNNESASSLKKKLNLRSIKENAFLILTVVADKLQNGKATIVSTALLIEIPRLLALHF